MKVGHCQAFIPKPLIVIRSGVFYLLVLLFAACQLAPPQQAPSVIIENAHNGGTRVRFNQAATELASGGWEGRISLWSLPQGGLLRSWKAHQGSVNGIAFIGEDEQLLSAGYDGVIATWRTDGVLLRRIQTPAPITAMAATPQRLLTGHRDGTVRFWEIPSLKLLSARRIHTGLVKAVAIESKARYAASGGADGEVYLLSGTDRVLKLPSPPTDPWTLAFSPDGKSLTGGGWFQLFRWSIPRGDFHTLPTEHHGIIKSVQYTEDGHYLATISRQTDRSVMLLDAHSGDTVRRFRRHELCGADIHFSKGERYLATTSDDASVRIWVLDGAR